MIFVGDDWAEDHHDVHVMDVTAANGWRRGGYPRDWQASAGSTS